jgi:hypothetical protein
VSTHRADLPEADLAAIEQRAEAARSAYSVRSRRTLAEQDVPALVAALRQLRHAVGDATAEMPDSVYRRELMRALGGDVSDVARCGRGGNGMSRLDDWTDLATIDRLLDLPEEECGPDVGTPSRTTIALVLYDHVVAARSERDEAIRQRDELAAEVERLRAELRETDRERDADAARIDELRAVLAPLLIAPTPAPIMRCVFCERYPQPSNIDPWLDPDNARLHAPDCPVLSRDRLLGRAPEGEQRG